MKSGLILMTGSVRGDVELARRAEAAGFDSVFTVEFFNRHGFVPLGAIAQGTSRIRIGTGIANSFTRAPLLHASAATPAMAHARIASAHATPAAAICPRVVICAVLTRVGPA